MLERFWWGLAIFDAHPRRWLLLNQFIMHQSPQRGISLHGNATYQRKYDLYYMFRLYIIYIDHILPALILLCPSKVIACIADRPSFSFILLKMGKGHQGEPHQTVNQNHCTQRYMWKTPRTGEMNPTYREKSFQMVISKSFPFFLGRRRKNLWWWCCRCQFVEFFSWFSRDPIRPTSSTSYTVLCFVFLSMDVEEEEIG